jgi:hypothetical protein
MKTIYRHGDLMITPCKSIPSSIDKKSDTILLEGEATGHMHALKKGEVYPIEPTNENNFLLGYFEVKEKTSLTHPEHKTIEVPPGKYKFFAQREYDPQENRRVID